MWLVVPPVCRLVVGGRDRSARVVGMPRCAAGVCSWSFVGPLSSPPAVCSFQGRINGPHQRTPLLGNRCHHVNVDDLLSVSCEGCGEKTAICERASFHVAHVYLWHLNRRPSWVNCPTYSHIRRAHGGNRAPKRSRRRTRSPSLFDPRCLKLDTSYMRSSGSAWQDWRRNGITVDMPCVR